MKRLMHEHGPMWFIDLIREKHNIPQKLKYKGLIQIIYIAKLYKYINDDDSYLDEVVSKIPDLSIPKNSKEGYLITAKDFLKNLKLYPHMGNITKSVKFYFDDIDSKDYLFTGPLMNALLKAKVNFKTKHLPNNLSCYIEANYQIYLKKNIFIIGTFLKIGIASSQFGEIPKGAKFLQATSLVYDEKIKEYGIEELLTELQDDEKNISDYISENYKDSSLESFNSSIYNQFIFSASAYLGSKCEELNDLVNFESSRKYFRQNPYLYGEIIRNTRPYRIVGRNFNKYRKKQESNISIKGHWRWQHYGKENSLLKFIYISEYVKNKLI